MSQASKPRWMRLATATIAIALLSIVYVAAGTAQTRSDHPDAKDGSPGGTFGGSSLCENVMSSAESSAPAAFEQLRGTDIPTLVWQTARLGSVTCIADNMRDEVTAVLIDFAMDDDQTDGVLLLPSKTASGVDWQSYLVETLEGNGQSRVRTNYTADGAVFAASGATDQIRELEALVLDPSQEHERSPIWNEIARERGRR